MMKPELAKEAINQISPLKLERYLESKGWRRKKLIANVASVWFYPNKEKKIGVLVPLDREFADFENRMIEVLKVLEKIEKRPNFEIYSALQQQSIIAQLQNREILEFRFDYVNKISQEAPAKKMGSLLKSLQDFFSAIGEYKVTSNKLSVREKIKSELEVSILETFQGSFGLKLGLSQGQPRQLNLLEEPIAQEAAQHLLELIKASENEDSEIFKKKISELYGKPSVKFKSFLSNLLNLETNLYLDWGSVNPDKGGLAKVSHQNLLKAWRIISQEEKETTITISVIGKLILAGIGDNKKTQKFIFEEEETKEDYKGSISRDLLNNINNDLNIGKQRYRATIEEVTSVNTATGEEETNYMLVGLENLSYR